jgi:hypothetical protein
VQLLLPPFPHRKPAVSLAKHLHLLCLPLLLEVFLVRTHLPPLLLQVVADSSARKQQHPRPKCPDLPLEASSTKLLIQLLLPLPLLLRPKHLHGALPLLLSLHLHGALPLLLSLHLHGALPLLLSLHRLHLHGALPLLLSLHRLQPLLRTSQPWRQACPQQSSSP